MRQGGRNFNSEGIYDKTDFRNEGGISERTCIHRKGKDALFIVTPDSDKSYAFLIGLLYEQLMQELYFQADTKHGGRKAGYQGLCDYLKSA